MRYLLLAYGDRGWVSGLSDGERAAGARALRAGGYLLAAQRLDDGAAATTVRAFEGVLSVDAGPQATGTGLLAVFMIETRDLNDAIRLTAGLPEARHGPVEIWPVQAPAGAH